MVEWRTQSGSGLSPLAEELRHPGFKVGGVLILAAGGGPQVQVVGFEALVRSRGGGACCRRLVGGGVNVRAKVEMAVDKERCTLARAATEEMVIWMPSARTASSARATRARRSLTSPYRSHDRVHSPRSTHHFGATSSYFLRPIVLELAT